MKSKHWVFGGGGDEDRAVHLYFRNRVEDAKGNEIDCFPWSGRVSLSSAQFDLSLEFELGPNAHHTGASIRASATNEDNIQLFAGLWKIACGWLSLETRNRAFTDCLQAIIGEGDISRRYATKEVSIRFHSQSVWWNMWTDTGGWTSERPRWRDGSFNFVDALLGKEKHRKTMLASTEILVAMPEGDYRGTCKIFERSWARPRWFSHRGRYADVEMLDPVPVPGKGESGYDCDDDALHGLSCNAGSVGEAIGHVVGSVMRDRESRAGLNWAPPPRKAA